MTDETRTAQVQHVLAGLALNGISLAEFLDVAGEVPGGRADGGSPPAVRAADSSPAATGRSGHTVAEMVDGVIGRQPGYGNNCYLTTFASGWMLETAVFEDHFDVLLETADEHGLVVDEDRGSYQRRIVDGQSMVVMFDGFAGSDVLEIAPIDVLDAMDAVRLRAVFEGELKAAARAKRGLAPQEYHGDGAADNMLSAVGHLFSYVRMLPWGRQVESPAVGLDRPQRHATSRSRMTPKQLREVELASLACRDTELGQLLWDFHRETGARRIEGIRLRVCDVDVDRCMVRLRGKKVRRKQGASERWVPVSPSLIRRMLQLAWDRGARSGIDKVLLRPPADDGSLRPVTSRVYDKWGERVQKRVPWAATGRWGSHWLRHHRAAEVEIAGGKRCKRALLGHGGKDVSDDYGVASPDELAVVIEHLTGEWHQRGHGECRSATGTRRFRGRRRSTPFIRDPSRSWWTSLRNTLDACPG